MTATDWLGGLLLAANVYVWTTHVVTGAIGLVA